MEKDFEYYENQAAYFAYTHDPDDYDVDFSDEYMDLDPAITTAIEKRGAQDRIEGLTKRNPDQLVEFVVFEGLLTKDKAEPLKNELHMDYMLGFWYR